MFIPLAIIISIFAAPELEITRSLPPKDQLKIEVKLAEPDLAECVQNGFAVSSHFYLQLCRRRSGWFSACKDQRTINYTLVRDPISEGYQLESDLIGDKKPALSKTISSLDLALHELSRIETLALTDLSAPQATDRRSDRNYFLAVRFTASCQGGSDQTLERLSSLISLGLFRFNKISTGWVYFELW